MSASFSNSELEAYLDEELSGDDMARIEGALRKNHQLAGRLVEINRRRDSGAHSVGEIWRRHRLSCPSRAELGSYLLDALDSETSNYVYFHITEIGCRYCQANLEDLREQHQQTGTAADKRRQRYFQSSAGYLERL
jgi:hypothetical protein